MFNIVLLPVIYLYILFKQLSNFIDKERQFHFKSNTLEFKLFLLIAGITFSFLIKCQLLFLNVIVFEQLNISIELFCIYLFCSLGYLLLFSMYFKHMYETKKERVESFGLILFVVILNFNYGLI